VCISLTTAQECTRKTETYIHIAKPLKTQTHESCTDKCYKSPNCVSWTWNKKKKKCHLIREFDLAERTPWISGNCEGVIGGVTCGDGQSARLCNECPANEPDCTSDDCEFLDGKCEPRNTPTNAVTCGDGQSARLCNECPANEPDCTSDDCEFLDGKCEPREKLKFDIFLDSFGEAFARFEANTTDILDWSENLSICWPWIEAKCAYDVTKVLVGCAHCSSDKNCWETCLINSICSISGDCMPGGVCWSNTIDDIIQKIIGNNFDLVAFYDAMCK